MKTLKESILQDADITLSITDNDALQAIYPLPTVKNFYKFYSDHEFVDWYCASLIQKYVDKLNTTLRPLHKSRFEISSTKLLNCIRISIYGKGSDADIRTYFVSKDNPESTAAEEMFELYGVGDWVSNSMSKTKKEIIKALHHLAKHPEDFKKLVDCNNRCANELENTGMCDNRTFKAILGY